MHCRVGAGLWPQREHGRRGHGATAISCRPPKTRIGGGDVLAWEVVPSANVGTGDNHLNAVAAVSATDVWAVGYYRTGGIFRTLIERWNGTWSVVSSPNVG